MTFDPVAGKEKEFTRIEDPEWYWHNWTLSTGSTLAPSEKHRTQEQAMIR